MNDAASDRDWSKHGIWDMLACECAQFSLIWVKEF